jgi:hypothetical protein
MVCNSSCHWVDFWWLLVDGCVLSFDLYCFMGIFLARPNG